MAESKLSALEKMFPTRDSIQLPRVFKEVRFEDYNFDEFIVGEGTFHPFPRLPIELRYQIWELYLPKPRVIEFKAFEKERPFSLLCYSLYPTLISQFEQMPLGVLPYICNDSRTCFLAKYRLCFDGMIKHPLYFDPKADVVMFKNEYALELFSNAVNGLPSADVRESVAPVRKAAIRWTVDKTRRTPAAQGVVTPFVENIALDASPGGARYRLKLRILFERLPTLKQFGFCYLDRDIGKGHRKNMIRFVESMEQEMKERLEAAKEITNKSITESTGNCPSILTLHCPEERIVKKLQEGPSYSQIDWSTVTMSLETRTWECSRDLVDWDAVAFGGRPRLF